MSRVGHEIPSSTPTPPSFARGWWRKPCGAALPALALCALMAVSLPLGSAFELWGDEGFELMKALLLRSGIRLYTPTWDDQPPLFTAMLACAVGPSQNNLLAARLLCLGFAGLLLWCFFSLIQERSGYAQAFLAFVVLIGSPSFLQLSVSVIQEPTTVALALFSLRALFAHLGLPHPAPRNAAVQQVESPGTSLPARHQVDHVRGGNLWLYLSGIAMGLAMQVKLTAAIFIPALAFELIRANRSAWRSATPNGPSTAAVRTHWAFEALRRLCIWTAFAALAFGSVWSFFPGENTAQLLGTHFSRQAREAFAHGPSFEGWMLFRHVGVLLAAGFGTIMIAIRRRSHLLMFCLLFATVYFAHSVHRPFWPHYWLHFEVPLAWLAAVGAGEAFTLTRGCKSSGVIQRMFRCAIPVVMVLLLAPGVFRNVPLNWRAIRDASRVEDDPAIRKLRDWRDKVRWMYCEQPIVAFHAGIKIPPEIAVVSRKRVVSGQIDNSMLFNIVNTYRPEIVMIPTVLDEQWMGFVRESYEAFDEASYPQIYVRRDLRLR